MAILLTILAYLVAAAVLAVGFGKVAAWGRGDGRQGTARTRRGTPVPSPRAAEPDHDTRPVTPEGTDAA